MKGTGEYPDNWLEIATKAKREAGWRCVRCGHPDDPALCLELGIPRGQLPCDDGCVGHEATGKFRVLTVHHLDGDKENNRWWNIPPLCQSCHLEIQAKVRMAQRYLLPHSVWFRPYVAGYYAFTVLDEELERDEVEERMEEILRAGQPDVYLEQGA